MGAFSWFFGFLSVAGVLDRALQIKTYNCVKKVLCCLKTGTSVYDYFSQGIFVQIIVWESVLKLYPAQYQI